ncbi:MAG: ABC transporter permease [Gemmatimonadota bacterium]|nr:ABC transporter permease [Gemmatimonadota bacterium]
MSFVDGLRHQLRALTGARQYARELDEEMHFHLSLDAMQREHAARGALSSDDARFAARRKFGNLTSLTEETRAMAGFSFLDATFQDARFALRTFRRAPAFTAVAMFTLAIGIGANTAIFSAVNALLLRPLPFPQPERLMQASLTVPARNGMPARDDAVWSYPKFVAFRDAQHLFSDLALYTDDQNTIAGGGEAERIRTEVVGARYLSTLGIEPQLGRNFLPEEDLHPDGPRVAILSDELWTRRFNADPAILGKIIDFDAKPFTIVGVLPPGFRGLTGRAELLTNLMSHSSEELNEAWSHAFSLVARLAPGVSIAQAKVQVPRLGVIVDRAYPHPEIKDEHWGAVARELNATRVDPVVRKSLLVLLAAVGLVLLIACANVANLFLVRASGRRREIAVRLAVGAGRGRLIRQLLTESVILSIAGGFAGLAIAWWGVRLLAALDPSKALRVQNLSGIGAVSFSDIHLDGTTLVFAALLAMVTGIIFGLVPALQSTHRSLTGALKEEAGSGDGSRRILTSRNVLATIEIALAVVLLAGSGLMLRSLGKLLNVNPGFDSSHTLTMRFNTPEEYGGDSLPGFFDEVLERTAALPGAIGSALVDCAPLHGRCNGTVIIFRDQPAPVPGTEPEVGLHWISPTWLSLMHVPLVRGRFFTRDDRVGVRKVVLVNDVAARRFWPGQDPIGKPVSVGQGGFWKDTAYVVGVVGDVRFGSLDSAATPDVYLSYYQSPRGRMMLMLRSAGDEMTLGAPARQLVHTLLPTSPVYEVRTMRERVADAMRYARFSTIILALFGVVALALATMGTYGVISFGVAQRTREIGIRVALGAQHGSLLRMIVRQGLVLAVVGGVIGLTAALAATRILRSLLFEVVPSDPFTFAAILALLGVAVLAASWIPARRAATIHPSEALREG